MRGEIGRRSACLMLSVVVAWSSLALEITGDFKIVVPDPDAGHVNEHLETAAKELANDIAEATDLRLEVVRAKEAVKVSHGIFIGAAFAKKAGLWRAGTWEPMENVVAEKGGSVYLFGQDMSALSIGRERPDWYYRCLPSVRAVCNFMEREMDIAFLSLGRTGRDVRRLDGIAIADGTFRVEKPRILSGIGRHQEMMYDIANGIFGFCRMSSFGGHTYPAAVPWKKYHESHPEYFPSDGTRRTDKDLSGALCISNPEVKRLIVETLLREFDAGADSAQLGQQDSKDFCQCPQCRAFGGVSDVGEKFWIFHRQIAEELYRLRPKKTVHILSYMATLRPPKTFKEFPPNVMIELCDSRPSYFRMWKNFKVPRGFTNYLYIFGIYRFLGLTPRCAVHHMAREARRYAAAGMRSCYRCGYGDLYGLDGRGYYVFNKTLLDPTLDENKLADDYVRRMYGPAAERMGHLHNLLDMRVSAYSKIREGYPKEGEVEPYYTWTGRPADYFAYMYPKDIIEWFDLDLSEAEKCGSLTEKQRRRLALVRREYDYLRNLAKIIHLYNAYRYEPTVEMYKPLGNALRERKQYLASVYGPNGYVKPIEGWPEMQLFLGVLCNENGILYNGWGDARQDQPLAWDPDRPPEHIR